MMEDFIITTNKRLERDKNETLEYSFDEPHIKTQWDDDDYESCSFPLLIYE
jgi:hypothetical protein